MVHQILEWRNHPEIRRWMVNADEISREDHLNWWSNTKIDPGKHGTICQDHKSHGYQNFTEYRKSVEVSHKLPWAPKGTGYRLGVSAMTYAFSCLNAISVIGEVVPTNRRSLALHHRLGFEPIRDDQSRMNETKTEVLLDILILTKQRWMVANE